MEPNICKDIREIKELKTASDYICKECKKTGSDWVHLRTCQACGVTLCCDNSPNKHMTKHYHRTQHPVVTSAEPGEQWLWCYKDQLYVEY